MMKTNPLGPATCLFILSGLGLGMAQAQPTVLPEIGGVAASGELKKEDRDFLTKSLRAGEDMVDLAGIASNRAVFPQVRTFAGEIGSAHGKANQELAAIILKKGARSADRDTVAVRELAKEWNEKSGSEFDEDFLKATIDLHEDMIDLLEDGADSKEPDIAGYSRRQLPHMKAHVERARTLLKEID